jgi:hypothetical protein
MNEEDLETGLARPNSWRMAMMMMNSAECGENIKSGECLVPRGPMFHHSWYRKVLEKHFVQKDDLSGGYVAHTVVFGYINDDNFESDLKNSRG